MVKFAIAFFALSEVRGEHPHTVGKPEFPATYGSLSKHAHPTEDVMPPLIELGESERRKGAEDVNPKKLHF